MSSIILFLDKTSLQTITANIYRLVSVVYKIRKPLHGRTFTQQNPG